MLVVGLTGGIGSGKSTVAKLFNERGVPIIDADIAARTVTAPDQPAFLSITEHFGPSIVLPNGTLDRAKLRTIIFSDPAQRLWLEKLLHPLIEKEMARQIQQVSTSYCIAVIPLLFEAAFYSFVNRILVVDTPEALQIERASQRDSRSRADIEAIIQSQISRKDRIARAHDIIKNEGSLDDLIQQVDMLHTMYTYLAK